MGALHVLIAHIGTGAAGGVPPGVGIGLDIFLVDHRGPAVVGQVVQQIGRNRGQLEVQVVALDIAVIIVNVVVTWVKLVVLKDEAGQGVQHVLRSERVAIGEHRIIPDGELQQVVLHPLPGGGDAGFHLHCLIVELQDRVIHHG